MIYHGVQMFHIAFTRLLTILVFGNILVILVIFLVFLYFKFFRKKLYIDVYEYTSPIYHPSGPQVKYELREPHRWRKCSNPWRESFLQLVNYFICFFILFLNILFFVASWCTCSSRKSSYICYSARS